VSLPLTPTELQAPEVLQGQRREWTVERCGWLVIGLVLAAGLAGLFGGGPLARGTVASGTLRLEFDRITRHSVPTLLRLQAGPGDAVDGRLRVSLDWDYLRSVNLHDIVPEPVSVVSGPDRVTWEFAAGPSGTAVEWEIEPSAAGRWPARLEVGGRTRLDFRQIVFP
jgi:hypothetical protein